MRISGLLLTISLFFIAAYPAFAERNGYAVGLAPTYYQTLSVVDPNGPTNNTNQFSMDLVSIIKINRIDRIYSEAGLYNFKLRSGVANIGQQVDGYFYAGYYQHRFRIARNFKPWLGFGIAVNYLKFKARNNIDSDGYLASVYPDRKGASFDFAVNANYSFELSRRWDFDVFLGYLQPIGDSIKSFRYGSALIYNF